MIEQESPPFLTFRAPRELALSTTAPKRILVVGSCLMAGYPAFLASEHACEADYIVFNNVAELPSQPSRPLAEYDFQLVQIPLRSVLPEHAYLHIDARDLAAHSALFEDCRARLTQLLESALRYNDENGILTFVYNFLRPQQNPMGRLLPRHDLRNLVHLVGCLNHELEKEVSARRNAYVLDIEEMAASYGKMYIQDDLLWLLNHGGLMIDTDHALDQARIEPTRRIDEAYTLRVYDFMRFVWAETLAMHRTARHIDSVKLVVVDLDDTLWRGVVVEEEAITEHTVEGWPLGIAEALSFLKKRGVLLGIVSKNDPAKIEAVWNQIFGGRLFMSDFAVRKINWQPKTENLREMLREVNVLPRSVVFVDDNPVERAAVAAAFPDVRVLGAELYHIRRILLWSSEAQMPSVSDESSKRTELIQAQLERELARTRVSREEFLATLDLKVTIFEISSTSHVRFPRALELLNKSNQFNTTGERHREEECQRFFAEGGQFYAFEVRDRFTAYGLVGLAMVLGNHLAQFVMSCRVLGLDVEQAVIAEITNRLRESGEKRITARIRPTDANALCRDLFGRGGFSEIGDGVWSKDVSEPSKGVSHVVLSFSAATPPSIHEQQSGI